MKVSSLRSGVLLIFHVLVRKVLYLRDLFVFHQYIDWPDTGRMALLTNLPASTLIVPILVSKSVAKILMYSFYHFSSWSRIGALCRMDMFINKWQDLHHAKIPPKHDFFHGSAENRAILVKFWDMTHFSFHNPVVPSNTVFFVISPKY